MTRIQLGKDGKDELATDVNDRMGKEFLTKKDNVEIVDEDGSRLILVNGKKTLFYAPDGKAYPVLNILIEECPLPKVVVDMGAVKFVSSGADVMRPGIKQIPDGLAEGATICIVDERHGKPLAIGLMLLDSVNAIAATGGKIVKTLHWVGDKFWKA